MSTEFHSEDDQFAFLRWGCRTDHHVGGERTAFEFGTITNFEKVLMALEQGQTFKPYDGSPLASDPPMTVNAFLDMARTGRATFGEMSITVAVGSGELWRFTVEE